MAITVTAYQPVKLAAMEGVWQSQSCAPMFFVGWVNEQAQTTTGINIPVPCLLSILAYLNPQAVVTGLTAFPSDAWAPVNLVFQVYHLMIDLGLLFPLIGVVGLLLWWWGRRVYIVRPLLWVFVSTIVLTEMATIAGWWTAEIGRQPWIVWNLLRTADAVSPTLRTEQVVALARDVRRAVRAPVLALPLPAQPARSRKARATSSSKRSRRRCRTRSAKCSGIRAHRGNKTMWLNYIWFVLLRADHRGYLILDGFDLGVGILHLFVAGSDEERRLNLNTIGPIWDGNEVWLVLAGGVLFAAFPIVYASLFSGFLRGDDAGAAVPDPAHRLDRVSQQARGWALAARWDTVFCLASTVLALLLGVVFGNIVSGVPLDQQGNITIASILELLHPFALLVGVTTIVMLAMHGALYLNLKTEGQMQAKVRRYIPRLLGLLIVLGVLTDGSILVAGYQTFAVYRQIWPILLPLGAAAAAIGALLLLRRERAFAAFACSSAMVALLLFSVAVGLFPNLLISTTDPQYNLTVLNAASQPDTLQVMLIMTLIGMPFVLLYSGGVFYLFRGKVRLSSDSY